MSATHPPSNTVSITQLYAILAAINDGVVVSNFKDEILFINQAAQTILRKTISDATSQPIESLFEICKEEGQQRLFKNLAELKEELTTGDNPKNKMREVFLNIDLQIISARLTIAQADNHQPAHIVVVLRNITKEVEEAQRKSDFVSMVAHELRTPMTSIKGYTTLLNQGVMGELDEKQLEFINVIQRNVDRLSTLVNDLLDVSRIEAGKIQLNLKKIDIGELIDQVVEMLQISADTKNLDVILNIPSDIPLVTVDTDRITQVLTNLIGNAIAYTEAGQVTITVSSVPDALKATVKDTGVGIAPQDLGHIFERFYRADHAVVRANTGTGLGLPIVKSFIEMHGGRIWVESKLGEGSSFIFLLPLEHPNKVPE